jgi:transcriptional regulator with XRE-family HTH domain
MNISLSNKLGTLRRDAGLSENELAALIDVLPEKIIAWERAESEPTASELFEISKLYHVSIDELIKSEQFDTSMPISLKKERPSISLSPEKEQKNNFIREKLPENPTDREIYPAGYKGGAGAGFAGSGGAEAGFAGSGGAGTGFAGSGGAGTGFAGSGGAGAGGVQFIGADSDRFQSAPYIKPEDIKPRDFSHITYEEPQSPNINIKTVDNNTNNTGKSNIDLSGLLSPETAAKIGGVLTQAGALVGTTIDKVAEEVKRSVEKSAAANNIAGANSSAGTSGNYNPPPAKTEYSYSPPLPGMSRREQRRYVKEARRREKLQREMDKLQRMADKREKSKHRSLFYKLFPMIMTFLFFFVGANISWEWSWLFFLCVPIYYTLVEAIEKRDPRKFAYPVLVLLPYFFFGFVGSPAFFSEGLWLFATIPFYYIIADHVQGKKKQPPRSSNDEDIYPGNR